MNYEEGSYDPGENLEDFLNHASYEHIFEFFLDRKINPSSAVPIYGSNNTYLHILLDTKNSKVIDMLLDEGTNLNYQINLDVPSPQGGQTALHRACKKLNFDDMEFLLSRGAKTNLKNEKGKKPIHLLFNKYRENSYCMDELKLLLDNGVKVDSKDDEENTPLILASMTNCIYEIDYLLERGADINFSNGKGNTPLYKAYELGNYHICLFLLEKGAKVFESEKCYYMLARSCHIGQLKIVESLLQQGLNPNGEYNSDVSQYYRHYGGHASPLKEAVDSMNVEIIKLLLEYGVTVKCEDGIIEVLQGKDDSYNEVRKILEDHIQRCGNIKGAKK